MSKKIALILTIVIGTSLLFGCGSETPSATPTQTTYSGTSFTIYVPDGWTVLEPKNFTSNIPQNTLVGFMANIKNEVFTANVNVVYTVLDKAIDARDYAKSNVMAAQKALISFKEIGKEEYNFPYGKDIIQTYISTFEGKKNVQEPIVRFKQLYVVLNTDAYIVTGAYLPSENESIVKTIDEMLHSFSLK